MSSPRVFDSRFGEAPNGNAVCQLDLLFNPVHAGAYVLLPSPRPTRQDRHETGDRGGRQRGPAHRLHRELDRGHVFTQFRQRSSSDGLGRRQTGQRNEEHVCKPRQVENGNRQSDRFCGRQSHFDGEKVHRRSSAKAFTSGPRAVESCRRFDKEIDRSDTSVMRQK